MLTEQQFIKQLEQLISCASLSGNFELNRQALDLVVKQLSKKAIVQRLENQGTEILLASNTQSNSPQFGYMVHIDIVAAPTEMFKMTRIDDKIFGRGVSDMKFSIPLGVALLNELIEKQSEISFTLAITTDEEVGGFAGAAWLADSFGWRPEVLIVPDGGDNLKFVEKAKGVCQFEVTATGRAAHASRVWDGENALVKLCRLVTKLDDLFKENSLAPNWNTTLNVGQLNGGISTNQVCDLARVKLDFRYPESESIAKLETLVKKLAQEIDPQIVVKQLSTGLPTFTDSKLPVVQDFLACLKAESKQEIPIEVTYGASDARHFAQFGTPVLMVKPMGGDIHAPTEWLSVSSTMAFYQGLRKFLKLKD